jgi:hypothetical protein
MEFQHVNVKLFVKNAEGLDPAAVIPVFHGWIQDQANDELLLDVADYRHVHSGPGVVLVGHQGNYSLDNTGGRLGVRYNRKAILEGTNQDRLVQATSAALSAWLRLEDEPLLNGKLSFNGREIEVWLNDRLLAPNSEETRRTAYSDFELFFSNLFGGGEFDISYQQDPRSLLGVRATAIQSFYAAALLDNLHSLAPAPGPDWGCDEIISACRTQE